MEHRKALTCSITMINAINNNNSQLHNRHKKRIAKRQHIPSPSLISKDQHVPSVFINDSNTNQQHIHTREQQKERISMKKPLAWTKKWSKWFSPCGSGRVSQADSNSPSVSVAVS